MIIKNQKIQKLINQYKVHVKKHGLGEEAYKWELLQEYQGKLDLDADNLEEELKSMDYNNLIYHNGKTVMYLLAKEKTEQYRICLKAFFDENTALEQRINDFSANTLKLYRELEPKLQHHHDERTMATLLTYFAPEKYAFYKHSFYKKYCQLLEISQGKKNKKYIHYLELVNSFIEEYIKPDEELKALIKKEIPDNAFQDPNYLLLAQDILYRTLEDKLTATSNASTKTKVKDKTNNTSSIPLNQILFGPPGTGKTYHTIDLSVKIAAPNEYQSGNHAHNKTVYDRLLKEKQIQFVTFHQSMSYEDFIEGIKPSKNDKGDLNYEVEDGIFKVIARAAKSGTSGEVQIKKQLDFKNKDFHKMSLGGKNQPEIHQWCVENKVISFGIGEDNDFTSLKKAKDWTGFKASYKKKFPKLAEESRFNIQAMYSFMHTMKKGDIVIITKGNHIIDAVGIIKSDYYFDDNKAIEYCHFRDVEWIVTEMDAVPEHFVIKNISQMTVYQFDRKNIILEAFESLIKKEEDKVEKNFVLVIDEINRGNISQIFGELITLIEPDKRTGQKEGLAVQLPYSKEEQLFSVPPNLYIIGTMNTADRSVEAMDTALRRRFSFVPMFPKIDVLEKANSKFSDIDLQLLLKTINQRIEKLLNKDHTIGHSYFIKIEDTNEPLKILKEVFENKIIPLLQEYFYNDYENIGMVLGDQFVQEVKDNNVKFGRGFGSNRRNHLAKPIYTFTKSDSWTSKTFRSIYDNE